MDAGQGRPRGPRQPTAGGLDMAPFEPDAVMPAQFAALWTQSTQLTPDQGLRLAIVRTAVEDVLRNGQTACANGFPDHKAKERAQAVENAYQWLTTPELRHGLPVPNDHGAIFYGVGLVDCCEVLALDAAVFTRWALGIRAGTQPRPTSRNLSSAMHGRKGRLQQFTHAQRVALRIEACRLRARGWNVAVIAKRLECAEGTVTKALGGRGLWETKAPTA